MRTVYRDLPRPPAGVLAAFGEILAEYSPSCLVADARARAGALGGFTPVRPEHKVAGPVLTVRMDREELVDCPSVLRRARPGDVVLLACEGQLDTGMWGGLMSTLAQRAGIAATIVDGAIRDADEIRDLGYPVWSRGRAPRPSPTALHKRTEPVQVNVPVVVGGLVVNPGDIVVADENGLAFVPPGEAEEVVLATRHNVSKEAAIREKIDAGVPVADILAEFGHM
ncbi:RraA family protein [Amycolatopsis sacchari]|uniref:RraA family protein n=1 Tax=Amycolatopsis sacchari TaxID=115433 RepID=UPI003D70D99E